MADDVAVMYAGRIVERASVREIYARPLHPYMAALLAARPRVDAGRQQLQPIRGTPPDLAELTGACAFLPRCGKAVNTCRAEPWPPLRGTTDRHEVACHHPMFAPAPAK
jgi:oligopeptide/dipeptide ABC transporter ATP-binding protein